MKFIMKNDGKTEKDIHNLRRESEVIHSFFYILFLRYLNLVVTDFLSFGILKSVG